MQDFVGIRSQRTDIGDGVEYIRNLRQDDRLDRLDRCRR